ncbi:MAG: hypothetical protein P4M02_11300 [Clostridia bacterium]|nr:hypothetical protein [Clostridia bacterium]
METKITIADKTGSPVKHGIFTEPEMRMAAKAGYRVFEDGSEITQRLMGLFSQSPSDQDFK